MSVGIRIRGVYGQMQISDDIPINTVLFQGSLGGLTGYTDPQSGIVVVATGVTFPAVINTTQPPLVFLKITNTVQVIGFRLIGQPGAWTGFSIFGLDGNMAVDGSQTNTPIPVEGTWFITTTQSGKSNAKYGIRIRNKDTGAIIYDSGFKIAKFLSWTPTFNNFRVISTGHDSGGVGGGTGLWYDWCRVDTPAPYVYNGHFLANGFTGYITGVAGQASPPLRLYFNAGTPWLLTADYQCVSGTGPQVIGRNAWNLVWATPGP